MKTRKLVLTIVLLLLTVSPAFSQAWDDWAGQRARQEYMWQEYRRLSDQHNQMFDPRSSSGVTLEFFKQFIMNLSDEAKQSLRDNEANQKSMISLVSPFSDQAEARRWLQEQLAALPDTPATTPTPAPTAITASDPVIADGAYRQKELTNVTITNNVASIGVSAFAYNHLTSITIPNNVTAIGEGAFANNQLKNITISNSVTYIGKYAFSKNQLTSITIPNKITSIEQGTFADNKLTSVTIPNSVTTIGEGAFANNQLTSVTIPSSVTSIGYNAFRNNKLTSIIIPNGVETIGQNAFLGNQITSITIPCTVWSIGGGAFYGNPITNITVTIARDGQRIMGIPNNFDAFYHKQGKKAGTYIFSNGEWNIQ